MPIATLLLRESSSTPLTVLVEKALQRKPPLLEYYLHLNSCQLDFTLLSKPEKFVKTNSLDEGFESDIDSVSIVSSDESFTSNVEPSKIQETDSANGSACSDSDDTDSTTTVKTVQSKYSTLKSSDVDKPPKDDFSVKSNNVTSNPTTSNYKPQNDTSKADQQEHKPQKGDVQNAEPSTKKESFNLVDCLCYTDVKIPELLLFVIKEEVLVFRFVNLGDLQKFYANFSALKAVTNQKAYSKNFGAKFNLLQRTDSNGVTHIEISREPKSTVVQTDPKTSTNIISINTPENNNIGEQTLKKNKTRDDILLAKSSSNSKRFMDFKCNTISKFGSLYLSKDNRLKNYSTRQRSESTFYAMELQEADENSNLLASRSASIDNLLADLKGEKQESKPRTFVETNLKKVWSSVEDLLKEPKRPERRRRPKGPAPQPPDLGQKQQNVLKGQYVRVNVPKFDPATLLEKSQNVFEKNAFEKNAFEKNAFDKNQAEKTQNISEKNYGTLSSSAKDSYNKFQSLTEKAKSTIPSLLGASKAKLTTYQQFKYSEPKKIPADTSTLTRNRVNVESHWTNSVPRLLKKQGRSRSETRNFTPMAYRYIDTTQDATYHSLGPNYQLVNPAGTNYQSMLASNYAVVPGGTFQRSHKKNNLSSGGFSLKSEGSPQTISNRLFGMSSKLKDYSVGSSGGGGGGGSSSSNKDGRYSSLGELNYRYNNPENNLKSVIKKDDGKRKNEKKVTFSVYTTVQVV